MTFSRLLLVVSLIFSILILSPAHSFAGQTKPVKNKQTEKAIKKALKQGTINKSETCLDEYFERSNSLKWKSRLIPVGGTLGTAAMLPASYYVFALGAGLFMGPSAAMVVGIMGGISALSSWGGSTFFETQYAVVRLRAIRPLLYALWDLHQGPGEHLLALKERFELQTGRNIDIAHLRQKLDDLNGQSILCNGKVNGVSSDAPLRKRLVDEVKLFELIE